MKNRTGLTQALLALILTFAVNITAYAGSAGNPPNSFGDFVWNDLNGDGFQNTGEPGLSDIGVRLCDITGGVDCLEMDTTTTDMNGNYSLLPFFIDTEQFRVEILSIPLGFTPTTPTSILFDNSNSQLSGQTIMSADFGFRTVVPVPAAMWLFGSGLLGLIGIARRKHRIT